MSPTRTVVFSERRRARGRSERVCIRLTKPDGEVAFLRNDARDVLSLDPRSAEMAVLVHGRQVAEQCDVEILPYHNPAFVEGEAR